MLRNVVAIHRFLCKLSLVCLRRPQNTRLLPPLSPKRIATTMEMSRLTLRGALYGCSRDSARVNREHFVFSRPTQTPLHAPKSRRAVYCEDDHALTCRLGRKRLAGLQIFSNCPAQKPE